MQALLPSQDLPSQVRPLNLPLIVVLTLVLLEPISACILPASAHSSSIAASFPHHLIIQGFGVSYLVSSFSWHLLVLSPLLSLPGPRLIVVGEREADLSTQANQASVSFSLYRLAGLVLGLTHHQVRQS